VDFQYNLTQGDTRFSTTLGDIVDITHQKLDFSLLCQQASSYIYIMGGFVEDSQCFVEKYDLQKGKWEIAGTFYNNRTKFSSIVLPHAGTILIMGGKQVNISLYILYKENRKEVVLQHVKNIV